MDHFLFVWGSGYSRLSISCVVAGEAISRGVAAVTALVLGLRTTEDGGIGWSVSWHE